MFALSGFRVVEEIGSNEEISLYRVVRLDDNLSMIAKTTCDAYAGPDMTAAFRYEFERLQQLNGKGTVKPYSLELAADRPILLLRDSGGTTLERLLRTRRATLKLTDLLTVAIGMADSLRQIHDERMTLREIVPLYAMVGADLTEVKWIDVRSCSADGTPNPLPQSASRPDAVLPYLSPEQTGRTGMEPGYRSDFYSLGVVLYEWFAGSLPFQSSSALDMVYYHLAATPEPVHSINPSIPRIVSDIVGKCMEKMPEARYASAYGIRTDLEECLAQLRVSGKVQPFPLAVHDISQSWIMSEEIFGRCAEQEKLLQALRRVFEGPVEAVWVSGDEGIGKTKLALETLRKAVPADSFFAVGKAEATATARPYDIWIQTIEQLTDHLLALNQVQVEVWKLRILEAVQGCGQLLTDMVPRLELLIGQQSDVDDVPPAEAQNRLHLVMNRFFQLFAGPSLPLVLFFDDLQRADGASIWLLGHLLEDRDCKHLLVVGAYRDQEVPPPHPLSRLISRLEETGARIAGIHLSAYDREALREMLSPILLGTADGADELIEVLLHKSEGNPLLLKQFLQRLLDRKLVAFDQRDRTWKWHVAQIAELNVSEPIAASKSDALEQLSGRDGYWLGIAAFLGKQFDLPALSRLTDSTIDTLLGWVERAVSERLLQPIHGDRVVYMFQHGRIRQSAMAYVPIQEREELHLRIGQLLAQRIEDGEDVDLFDALSHLNQAVELIVLQGKKRELAQWNLKAGLKAKQSIEFEKSLDYLRLATDLLDEACWSTDYSLTYQAYKERAEAEFLCAHFAEAYDAFDLVMEKAAADLDKAQVCIMMLRLAMNRDRHHEVIALGERALSLLGIRFNFAPSTPQLLLQLSRVRRRLRKFPAESFVHLPPMTDDRYQAAMSVLVSTSIASFSLNKKGWLSTTLTMLEITMDEGLTPEASIGLAGYSMLLNFQFHKHEDAYKWGKLACTISMVKPRLHAQVYSAFLLCYDSWFRYEPDLLPAQADHAIETAVQSGDLWQANHSVLIHCGLLFQFGYPLKDSYERLISHSAKFGRNDNGIHWKQAAILAQLITMITGSRVPNDPFSGVDIEARSFTEDANGDIDPFFAVQVDAYRYITCYLFGDYEQARQAVDRCLSFVRSGATLTADMSGVYYYDILISMAFCEDGNKRQEANATSRIRQSLVKLKAIARNSPEMYAHKYLMAKAEMSRLKRKNRQAESWFEQALDAARNSGFTHDMAIISESFAKYYLQIGKPLLAKLYMNEAYEAYRKWGAHAKMEQIAAQYGHLLQVKKEADNDMERIDYLSVVLSAQALSGEMEMDKLLQVLLRIMLQNAGAEYGALIFDAEDEWTVKVYGTAEELQIEPVRLEEAGRIVPTAIIGYTARTKEEVVLRDAASSGMFERNDYIKLRGVKSVLCLPIVYQNKLICLLYMENNLSSGVFTEKRLDVLKLLSSQCAISIANASLYSGIQYLKNSLEDQVEERTRTLEKSMKATSEALAEMTVYAERNRIAQEIHDIVGHTLTSTVLQIEAGKRLLRKDVDEAVLRLKEAQDLVRHSLSEIRNSVHMLKEDKYYDIGEALRQLVENTERNTGVVIQASIDSVPHLPLIHKKVLYHALQEGLTNGIRHGGSTEFSFSLQDDGSQVHFRLADNGTGASGIEMGFGLKMMKDRVQQLKGTLYIDSETNKGCLLRIRLPYSL